MLIIFRYIFYTLYRQNPNKQTREPIYAICFMSVPIIFNIWMLVNVILLTTNTVLPDNVLVDITIVFVYLLTIFALYQYFGTEKRIRKIFDEFENITKKKKITLSILSLLIGISYFICSIMVSLHSADLIRCRDLGLC
ncbi:MAG: hypothetical protein RL662_1754 [Bacteroidota bacterium]|jgi:hypothetical protein